MLQNIKLDDKKYEDIRDEAISNIIKHCPQWTNHNTSDPGVTLVELFSSMTEMILYRLNQVPQKNYLAFIDLIGIKQRLPIPSKTDVTFILSDGYQMDLDQKDTVLLTKDSIVTTEPQGEEEAIIFETTNEIYLSNLKLLNVYSKKFNLTRNRDDIVNHTDDMLSKIPFKPFYTNNSVPNQVQIYLESGDFDILKNNVKATLMFRLPTTMREYKIHKDFMKNMSWQFFDGFNWLDLTISQNYKLILDEKDADVLIVTFEGNNEQFNISALDIFDEDENYHIRGTFKETNSWLQNLMIYEVSLVASSDEHGVLPLNCFHNYEQLDMNNDFCPFGGRPKLDNSLQDDSFIIRSDESLCIPDSIVSLELIHSNNTEYQTARGSLKLQIIWEYPVGISKWKLLEVTDTTDNFTKNGSITFQVPSDIEKIMLNGEDGFWIRARIVSGNFGEEEKTEYDEANGSVKVTAATLRPPLLDKLLIHYTLPRKDLEECFVFNNFRYEKVEFDKNRPIYLFKDDSMQEEVLILGFDSYLSDNYLDIYFDIDDHIVLNKNLYTKQRVIKWELFQDSNWKELMVTDNTDGLTKSGSVRIQLPSIDKLEPLTVYINELNRLWIKARVKFNALDDSPVINNIMLNTVEVIQKETFKDEYIGRSVGLPSMKFKLNYINLVTPPIIFIGEDEYKAVDRFIDYGKDDKVFRFNGITGEVEFGNGQYGAVPDLGLPIVAKEYSVTKGMKGNISKGNLKVVRESINYIDSVINSQNCRGGQDGDTLDDLKRYAPSVLKTMERAVTIEDYQLLSESFSPFIKKTQCVYKDGEVIIVVLTNDILETNGFINISLLTNLEVYLKERSLVTVDPIVISPKIVNIKIFIKLKRTVENYNYLENELSDDLLQKTKRYFDPFTGYDGNGYPLGREISKGDLHNIINSTNSIFYMSDMKFQRFGSNDFITKLNLAYNEVFKITDIVIEDISYDI